MSTFYVARSTLLSKWGSDVGLSKHIYKVGVVQGEKSSIEPIWAGLTDWKIVKAEPCGPEIDDSQVIERLALKAKMIDPKVYPRLRGTTGVFKVTPTQVENYVTVSRALAGSPIENAPALKPPDFANYLLNAAGLARQAPQDSAD